MLDRFIPYAFLGAIVTSILSIFVSNLIFGLAIGLWLVAGVQSRKLRFQAPPFAVWLAILIVAILVSIAASSDVLTSLPYLKKLIKLSYPFFIFTFFTRRHLQKTLTALFVALGASAIFGILQYFWLMDVHLMNRIDGFMSHWMTFSGQLMLGSVALAAYVLFYRSGKGVFSSAPPLPFSLSVLALMLFALVLTMTRNAWLGTLVGLSVVLSVYRLRLAATAVAFLLLAFFLSPPHFKQRVYSAFDPRDRTTRGRIELFETGKNMIMAQPLTGVGPRMVPRAYARYRKTDEFPGWTYQHLHNDAIQIAAEMGLVALAAWLALWIRIGWDLYGFTRRADRQSLEFCLSVGALGVLAAFLFSGMFEYNFGDSEILILLLFFIIAPYVANRKQPQEVS